MGGSAAPHRREYWKPHIVVPTRVWMEKLTFVFDALITQNLDVLYRFLLLHSLSGKAAAFCFCFSQAVPPFHDFRFYGSAAEFWTAASTASAPSVSPMLSSNIKKHLFHVSLLCAPHCDRYRWWCERVFYFGLNFFVLRAEAVRHGVALVITKYRSNLLTAPAAGGRPLRSPRSSLLPVFHPWPSYSRRAVPEVPEVPDTAVSFPLD